MIQPVKKENIMLKYEPGTRYSNSTLGDIATDKTVYGFQIFEQESTGRLTFIDPRTDMLTSLSLAKKIREEIINQNAPALLAMLEKLTRAINRMPGNNSASGLADQAEILIAKVKGE